MTSRIFQSINQKYLSVETSGTQDLRNAMAVMEAIIVSTKNPQTMLETYD